MRLVSCRPGIWLLALVITAILLDSGCVTGPRYARPTVVVPPAYKEEIGMKVAQPSDQVIRGKWWEIFQDPQLNSLEEEIEISNQNLKAAEAAFRQARAALRFSRANEYPTIFSNTFLSNQRQSANRALRGSGPTYYSDLVLPVDVIYEPDLWGRVRHTVETSRALAQSSSADLETVNLSLHAELAADYFALRGLDAEKRLLESTVSNYAQALELTQNRFRGGLASEVDVAQAQTQMETTRAQAIDIEIRREQFEHAIAELLGRPASSFGLPLSIETTPLPAIPTGLPSQLLERRPDVASSERRVAAANEQIGLAATAYFPLITLNAIAGLEGRSFSTWFLGPSTFWNLGPAAAMTLFDVGRRRSVSEQARAAYDRSVASYRETVLAAFREVEDNLSALRVLEEEARTQALAVEAAERSLALSNNRYRGGVTSYLEVITAQSAALANERTAVNILTRRMTASVLLIKALGGGWNISQLPSVN